MGGSGSHKDMAVNTKGRTSEAGIDIKEGASEVNELLMHMSLTDNGQVSQPTVFYQGVCIVDPSVEWPLWCRISILGITT